MADKGIGKGNCPLHGEYFLDAPDSPCPSCEEKNIDFSSKRTRDEFGDTVYEYCPHCETEVEIPSYKPSVCPGPDCGEVILPCAGCILNIDYDGCDWDEETHCSQFPK